MIITCGLHAAAVIQDNQRAVFFRSLALLTFSAGTTLVPTELTFGLHAAATAQANQSAVFFKSHAIHSAPLAVPPLRPAWLASPQPDLNQPAPLFSHQQLTNAAVFPPPLGPARFTQPQLDLDQPAPVWSRLPPPGVAQPELSASGIVSGLHAAATAQAGQHATFFKSRAIYVPPGVSSPLRRAWFAQPQVSGEQPAPSFRSAAVFGESLQYFMRFAGEEQQLGRHIDSVFWGGGILQSVAPTPPPLRPAWFAQPQASGEQPAPLFTHQPPSSAALLSPPLRSHIVAREQDDPTQPAPIYAHHPPPTAILEPPPPRAWFGNVVDVPYQPFWFQQVNQALMEAPVPPPVVEAQSEGMIFHARQTRTRTRPPFDQRGKYPRREHELRSEQAAPVATPEERAQVIDPVADVRVMLTVEALRTLDPMPAPVEMDAPDAAALVAEEAMVAQVIAALLAPD